MIRQRNRPFTANEYFYYHVVLAARGLLGKDSAHTSDVYCQVYLDKEKVFKSEILKKTVDPVFEHEKGKIL